MRGKPLLTAVLVAGLLPICLVLAGAYPIRAQCVNGPKLNIINNSGYPDDQVYLIFLGQPRSNPSNYHHLKWQEGENLATFPVIDTSENTLTIAGANNNPYADYSTTLDKLSLDPSTGNRFFHVPKKVNASIPDIQSGLTSGRLWISFKKPLYLHVESSFKYDQPSFSNSTDANYNTVFDFFESTIGSDGSVHANTTNVDSVAMPLLYELKNGNTSLGKKGLSRPLAALRQAFLNDPVFKNLVSPTCIMAPGHGIENGKIASTYYEDYVDYCWKYYENNLLAFVYYNTWWSGTVNPVTRKLALTGWHNGVTQTYYIDRPSSMDIFFCNGVFNGPDETDKGLKNQIASALNRTVMHLPPYPTISQIGEFPWQGYGPPTGANSNMFYQQNGLPSEKFKTNFYSKILHQLSYDGTIYGFAYDDNAKQSSFIDGVATDIILTIGNCRNSTVVPVLWLLLE